ncbi:MAG TPA: hypothetical protein ENH82_03150 [bacterium]|nr:hypothetical protein [bacterium]
MKRLFLSRWYAFWGDLYCRAMHKWGLPGCNIYNTWMWKSLEYDDNHVVWTDAPEGVRNE